MTTVPHATLPHLQSTLDRWKSGLVFLALVVVGMCISGWKSSPDFWGKTDFLVVILGIPILTVLLAIGWKVVEPRVIANTNGHLEAHWALDDPQHSDADQPETL